MTEENKEENKKEENKCDICQRIFSNKYKLRAHQNKKIICSPPSPSPRLMCKKCKKIYNNKSNLNRHYKNCKQENFKINGNKNNSMMNTSKSKIINTENSYNNTNSNNTTTNNVIVNIIPFDKINISDILPSKTRINVIKKERFNSMIKFLSTVHFDANRKNCHNVYLVSPNAGYGYVCGENNVWEMRHNASILDSLVDECQDAIMDILRESPDSFTEIELEKIKCIKSFLSYVPKLKTKRNKDATIYKHRIRRQMAEMLYRLRNIPKETRLHNEDLIKKEDLMKKKSKIIDNSNENEEE